MHSIKDVQSVSPEPVLNAHSITWGLPWARLISALREEIPIHELQPAIRTMAAEAHSRELTGEQFVIMVKRDLLASVELGLATNSAHRDVVDRLVSMCIGEYYRAD